MATDSGVVFLANTYADRPLNEHGTSMTELLLERRLAKYAVALRDPK
jgi:hypothetical protein